LKQRRFILPFSVFLLLSGILAAPAYAQLYVFTSTTAEGSLMSFSPFQFNVPYPFRPFAEQSLYWRGKNAPNNFEKTFYNVHSVYLRDSMMGIRVYGIDFDMLHEAFQRKKTNNFRYWNKMRMGFSLMLEKNYKHPPFPKGRQYEYINAEVFISYMHIPHKSRGDQSTKARIGTWMIMILAMPSQKYDVFLKIRPFASSWLKMYYTQEYEIKYYGLSAEYELNKMGYDNSKTHSSKEIYKGLLVMASFESSPDLARRFIRAGIKFNFRNH
jgi:hypothetical protein